MARDLLSFAGSHSRPDRPLDVKARAGIRGTGQRPQALDELATRNSFLLAGSDAEPRFSVSRISEGGNSLYEVTLDGDGSIRPGHLMGRSAERRTPAAILAEIDGSVSASGYRPDWADALFSPRLSPQRIRRTMRRLNGGPIEPLDVFGNDDRWQFQDAAWPYGLIGRIETSDGYSGSGVLVGDRVVVTAGHMVPWGASSWWMRFVPAYYDGVSLHGAGVESYVSDTHGYDAAGEVAGYDIAVLRLYEPLGNMLGYFGFNGYDEDWNDEPWWSIIGYPGAVASGLRPSFQDGISIWDVDDDDHGGEELESQTADVTDGNSGGPMYAWWGNDPRVIGVVSGAETDYQFPFGSERSNVMAGGSCLGNLIAWARSTWPL